MVVDEHDVGRVVDVVVYGNGTGGIDLAVFYGMVRVVDIPR